MDSAMSFCINKEQFVGDDFTYFLFMKDEAMSPLDYLESKGGIINKAKDSEKFFKYNSNCFLVSSRSENEHIYDNESTDDSFY